MVFKKTSQTKAAKFWDWFLKNNHKFLFLGDVSEQEKDAIMDDLLHHLHQYCEKLFFSVRHRPDEEMELVISADGHVEYFDDVEALVDAAPPIPRWQIVKFRQPHEPGFAIAYADKDYYPEDIIFLPLYNGRKPGCCSHTCLLSGLYRGRTQSLCQSLSFCSTASSARSLLHSISIMSM